MTQALSAEAEQARGHRRRWKFSRGYLFVAPAIFFFALLAVYPALYVAILSIFATGKGTAIDVETAGLANYQAILQARVLGSVLLQTLYYAGGATLLHLVLGFFIALLLNTLPLNRTFIRFARTLFLIPWAISPTVVAVIGRLVLHPQVGPIAIGLRQAGLNVAFEPLGNPETALLAVTLTNVWTFTPFYMLMLLAGMQGIDSRLYEAAVVDGASGWQQIRFVTIPAIRNLVLTLAIFDFVTTAAFFDLTWIMTQGGPVFSTEILPTWIYRTAFVSFEFGQASAIGIFLFLFSLVVSGLTLLAMDRR